MSRHRNAYDEDDLYDYDDYDDYDDYPPPPPKNVIPKGQKPQAKQANAPKQLQKNPVNNKPAKAAPKPVAASTGASNAKPSAESKKVEIAFSESCKISDEFHSHCSDDEDLGATASTSPLKSEFTLVVCGHVDAGKSTLIGNLLFLGGKVLKKTLHKYEVQSQESGKGSFALAWVMDESSSEREHGVTIDVAERRLETSNHIFTVLDAPGHKDFIPNLLTGAAHANVALLVVPASTGEFESSMSVHAQTREHALILRSMGIQQIILVINKMDTTLPPWSKQRFDEIDAEMRILLSEFQFNLNAVATVPVSGLTGVNLVKRDHVSTANSGDGGCDLLWEWYNGPTLLEAMDNLQPNVRSLGPTSSSSSFSSITPVNALRCIMTSSGPLPKGYGGSGGGGGGGGSQADISVAILRGTMRVGRSIGIPGAVGGSLSTNQKMSVGEEFVGGGVINPGSTQANNSSHPSQTAVFVVSRIMDDTGNLVNSASAGAQVVVTLSEKNKHHPVLGECSLRSGMVLFKGPGNVELVRTFQATIITTSQLSTPVLQGSSFEMYVHGQEVECSIARILASRHSNTNIVTQQPRFLSGQCSGIVELTCENPVAIELWSHFAPLGRFVLRSQGKTVAIGICEKIISN